MLGPRLAARRLERAAEPPAGAVRFSGFGLLSLPLESGDVIAFRHFTSSSLGPPFTCVWHRDPAGRWALHVNVAPGRSSAPFFAAALARVREDEIALRWQGRHEFSLHVAAARLQLAVRLEATPVTRALGAAAALLPAPIWRLPAALRVLGGAAGAWLHARPLELVGLTPSGHGFLVRPAAVWQVAAAAAVLDGRDLGSVALAADPPRLGSCSLPGRALLAALTEDYSMTAARASAADAYDLVPVAPGGVVSGPL